MLITWRVFAIFAFLTKSSVHNNSRELQEKEASPQTWVLAMKNPRILRGLRRFYRNDQDH